MVNASSVSFSGSVAAILLASGFLLTPEARQPPADAPPAPVADHNTFVSRYCASCHNDRLKRRGLTLDEWPRRTSANIPRCIREVMIANGVKPPKVVVAKTWQIY